MKVAPRENGSPLKARSWVVGVDLGGTKILAGLGDTEGNIRAELKVATRAEEGPEKVVGRIAQAVCELLQRTGVKEKEIGAMVVGAPGPLDPSSGIVYQPPNLPGWDSFPLKERLSGYFPDFPVMIDNDANLAALGEYRFGYQQVFDNLLFMTVGTGIGGGIIMDGRIHHGACGAAGEFGHMVILPEDGPLCGCGSHGCLETLASGTAIAREARDMVRAGKGALLWELAGHDMKRLTAEVVGEAARKADETASEIIARAGHYLGIGLANLVNIFNPAAIVIGGGVVFGLGESLLVPAREEMKRRAMKLQREKVQVLQGKLGTRAGLLGCFALAAQKYPTTPNLCQSVAEIKEGF